MCDTAYTSGLADCAAAFRISSLKKKKKLKRKLLYWYDQNDVGQATVGKAQKQAGTLRNRFLESGYLSGFVPHPFDGPNVP